MVTGSKTQIKKEQNHRTRCLTIGTKKPVSPGLIVWCRHWLQLTKVILSPLATLRLFLITEDKFVHIFSEFPEVTSKLTTLSTLNQSTILEIIYSPNTNSEFAFDYTK